MSTRPTTAAAAAPVRAWVVALALVLACALLQPRPSDAAAQPAPQSPATAVSSGAAKPKCVAGARNDHACRVGAVHDPDSQEEEGSSVTIDAPAAAPDDVGHDDGSDYNDPDVPNNDQLVVVGH